MQADEVLRPGHGSRQTGDRQRRGVGGDHRIAQRGGFCGGGDLALERTILEYRFDDQVAAVEVRLAVARLDQPEERVALLGAHVPPADLLVQQPGRVALALLRRFDGHVLEHHLDTRRCRYVGDTRTHHARAEHADLLRPGLRVTLRARTAGIDLIELKPEGADHVLRHLAAGQLGEVARLDDLRGVEVDLRALDRRTHDFLRRGEAAPGLVAQHARGNGQHLRHVR